MNKLFENKIKAIESRLEILLAIIGMMGINKIDKKIKKNESNENLIISLLIIF